MKILYIIFIHLVFVRSGFAYEIDNYLHRDRIKALPDALTILNKKTNELLAAAIERGNKEGCLPASIDNPNPSIFGYVKDELDGDPIGKLENWVQKDKSVPSFQPDANNNVYSKKSSLVGFVLTIAGLEGSINLNGHVIGIDKLGHFFSQGYDYYKWAHIQDGGLKKALTEGLRWEYSIYGGYSTGVNSYGDLGANFSGLEFWRTLYHGKNPHISCVNGKYVLVRPFNWAEHVNHSWDEAINCSKFNPKLKTAVDKVLKQANLKCPIEPDKCVELAKMNCAQYFVNSACLAVANGHVNKNCIETPLGSALQGEACSESSSPLKHLDLVKDFEEIEMTLRGHD